MRLAEYLLWLLVAVAMLVGSFALVANAY